MYVHLCKYLRDSTIHSTALLIMITSHATGQGALDRFTGESIFYLFSVKMQKIVDFKFICLVSLINDPLCVGLLIHENQLR